MRSEVGYRFLPLFWVIKHPLVVWVFSSVALIVYIFSFFFSNFPNPNPGLEFLFSLA